MSDNVPSAAEALAELEQARERAQSRVDELDRKQRAATEAVAQASGTVADLERRDLAGEKISTATRRQAEEALARAQAEAEQPWPQRRAGAEAAVRAADLKARAFVGQHLRQLVQLHAADGRLAAEAINAAAEAALAGFNRREESARGIGSLATQAGARIRPNDVTASKAERFVEAARALLDAGGEVGPELRRDPFEPIHGRRAEEEAAV